MVYTGAVKKGGLNMLTAGKLASKYGISRTALLYYDRLGLLCPSVRGDNGYRLYGEDDEARLKQVLLYRGVGVPLQKMPGLMRGEDDAVHAILLRRLYELGEELAAIKARQLALIGMIAACREGRDAPDGETLTGLLDGAGIGQEQSRALHKNLEQSSPEAHLRFLEALGFQEGEIQKIRARYAGGRGTEVHEDGPQ